MQHEHDPMKSKKVIHVYSEILQWLALISMQQQMSMQRMTSLKGLQKSDYDGCNMQGTEIYEW